MSGTFDAPETAYPPQSSRAHAHEGSGNSGNDGHSPAGLIVGIDPGVNGAVALLTAEACLIAVAGIAREAQAR